MMPRPKPVAALAVTAVVAVAAPLAGAGAAAAQGGPPAPTIPPINVNPPEFLCQTLAAQAQAAEQSGNHIVANILGLVLQVIGCGGAAT